MADYTYNQVPLIAGAYLLNANTSNGQFTPALPIFSSIADLGKMGFANVDDIFWVLPGYKLEGYDAVNYGTLRFTMDNTTGTKIMYQDPNYGSNLIRSIKLYLNNTILNEIYTFQLFSPS